MTIRATCNCGRELRLKDAAAGKKIRCSECGEVLRIPRRKRGRRAIDQGRDLDDSPIHHLSKTRPDTSASNGQRLTIDVTARIIGIALAIYTAKISASVFGQGRNLLEDKMLSFKVLWFVFVGIPGLFVAIKGVNFGPSAAINRQKGWGYILGGVVVMIGAVGLSAFISWVASAIAGPTVALGIGIFATGAIATMAGVVALITGQDMGNALEDEQGKPTKKKSRRKRNRSY